jgi:rhodanese-related sulfurtransferase
MSRILTALIVISVIFLGASFIVFSVLESQDTDDITLNNTASYINIQPEELNNYLKEDKDIYLLDVHIPEQPHIIGTDAFIPFNEIQNNIEKLPEDKNTEIVVYCRSGSMSETASEELIELGYTNVKNLSGGLNAWKAEGYE